MLQTGRALAGTSRQHHYGRHPHAAEHRPQTLWPAAPTHRSAHCFTQSSSEALNSSQLFVLLRFKRRGRDVNLIHVQQYLMGGSEDNSLFTVASRDRTRHNGYNLKHRKFPQNIRKSLCAVGVDKPAAGCPERAWSLHPQRHSNPSGEGPEQPAPLCAGLAHTVSAGSPSPCDSVCPAETCGFCSEDHRPENKILRYRALQCASLFLSPGHRTLS